MKKINLNIHMFIFLNLITITIINDIIIYLTGIPYNYSLLTCTLLVGILSYILSKKYIEIRKDFDKTDIIPILSIIILSIIKLLTIDDFIDTLTYHLYNQENPFIDKINFDLLTSSAFYFPLADRLNYLFSRFLGVRFGTILSCYAILILYYQLKNILKIFVPKLSTKLRTFYFIFIILSNSVAIYVASYFIDSFSSILLFELVYIFVQNINLFKDKKYLYFCSFIFGCLVGIKLTNLFLGFVIITLILIRNLKEHGIKILKDIRIYDYMFLAILAVLPFAIYSINNYIQTGNPVFPLLNNIFHSDYYKNTTAVDTRLGPTNILEFIFWPIYICFNMIKGNDIHGIIENIWGLGYILAIYTICTHKNQEKDFAWFSTLVFVLTIVWIKFASGYVRYGLVLAYCFYIITIYYLNKELSNLKNNFIEKRKNVIKLLLFDSKLFLIGLLFLLYLCPTLSYMTYCYKTIVTFNTPSNYEIQPNITAPYDINGVWISTRYNNYYTDLIRNENDPMYNLDILTPLDPMCKWESEYSEYAKSLFREKTENQPLYMTMPMNYSKYILELLEINNFKVIKKVGIYSDSNYLNPYNYVWIIQVDFKD